MKFNQKVFLMSYILVMIAIYMIGYMMISNNHKINIQAQLEKSIIQINRIKEEYNLFGQSIMTQVAEMYTKDNVYIELVEEEATIFTNMLQESEEIKEKILAEEGKTNSYIQGEKLYLCLKEKGNTIYTVTDIHFIFETRTEQIEFFIKISWISSLIISVVLYIGVSIITKKLKILKEAANEILKGNYEITVKNLGKDEFGTLGTTFNEMTNAIQKNMNEITKIAEDRKSFIGNLTHEIRTPLTSIIGYSSLIKNGKVKEQCILEDYGNRIYEEGSYIKEMSQKLMKLLLLDNKQIKLQPMYLSQALKRILEEIRATFKDLEIYEEITEEIWILSDEVLLKSLITNLVKNARQAYEANQKPQVLIKLEANANIEITDNGKGIAKEELEKIKTPFYTLNKDRNRESSGMGLGLPLCMQIAKVHGGEIIINSIVGKGTTIIINLGERIDEG